MYNLKDLIDFHARIRPGAPFLLLGRGPVSYRDIHQRVGVLGARLAAAGLQAGERVAVACEQVEDYATAMFACWAAGAAAVPLEARGPAADTAKQMAVAQPQWILRGTEGGGVIAAERLCAADADPWYPGGSCPAELLFTSGSSGVPKAVMLTHATLLGAAIESCASIALDANDVQVSTVPFWHAYGQNRGLISTAYAGASVHLVDTDGMAGRLEALRRVDPTVLVSMANFFGMLSFSKQRLGPRLRVALSGAAPLPPTVQRRFQDVYGVPLLTTYGLTECQLAACLRLDAPRPIGTVGYPIRGVSIRLVADDGSDAAPGETGRVMVKGHNVMLGYFGGADKKVTADGWLDTEDIGQLDEEGALRLLGRESTFIKRLGHKVFPAEIQDVLTSHPEVAEVGVRRVTSAAGVEELAASVVVKEGSTVGVDELLRYCGERLPGHKMPSRCELVKEIKKLPSGKPDVAARDERR